MTKEAMRLLGCDSGLEGWHIQQRALQVYIQILKKYQNLVTIDALGAIFAIIYDNRPVRSIETIPSFDQWSLTIENH